MAAVTDEQMWAGDDGNRTPDEWRALFVDALNEMPESIRALARWIVPGTFGESPEAEDNLVQLWEEGDTAGLDQDAVENLVELALEVHDNGNGDIAGALALAGIMER